MNKLAPKKIRESFSLAIKIEIQKGGINLLN
jgi:hypothetical protein